MVVQRCMSLVRLTSRLTCGPAWRGLGFAASGLLAASLFLPLYGVGSLLAPLGWPIAISQPLLGEPDSGSVREAWRDGVASASEQLSDAWRGLFGFSPTLARLADGTGTEFMPDLDEGDLLYMPSTFPAVSIGKAQEILQQTDRLIATVPEVQRVFGKVGRAETATDPAPLTMIETTILLKPKDEWREGMTMSKLKQELDALVKIENEELDIARLQPWKGSAAIIASDGLFNFGAAPDS